ncbi:hypothetical protein NBRC10512_000557 [Rhodotorula toruloides]
MDPGDLALPLCLRPWPSRVPPGLERAAPGILIERSPSTLQPGRTVSLLVHHYTSHLSYAMVKLVSFAALLCAPLALANLSLGPADASGYACYHGTLGVDANLDSTNCNAESLNIFSLAMDSNFVFWASHSGYKTGTDSTSRYITLAPGQTFKAPQAANPYIRGFGLESCALSVTNTGKTSYNVHTSSIKYLPQFITSRCPDFGSATNVPRGHHASWGGVMNNAVSKLKYTLTRVDGQK